MHIIKRSGEEQDFCKGKIIAAISKANETVEDRLKLTEKQICQIADRVEQHCGNMDRAMAVEEIQDSVETEIMKEG